MFLINIGNTITVFLFVGMYGLITLLLAPFYNFFQKQKLLLKSFVLEFVVLNYMELILSAIIQNRYSSLISFSFYTACTIIGILASVALCGFIFYCWYKIHKHKIELDTEEVQQEIGCFFEDFSSEGWKKWSILVFLAVRVSACVLIVLNNNSAMAQVSCFLAINVFALIWTVIIRPNKSQLMFIGAIISECGAVFASGIYFKLCNPDLSKREVEKWGDSIFYLYVGISIVNMITCTSKGIIEFYESYNKVNSITTPEIQIDKNFELSEEKGNENQCDNVTANVINLSQIDNQISECHQYQKKFFRDLE